MKDSRVLKLWIINWSSYLLVGLYTVQYTHKSAIIIDFIVFDYYFNYNLIFDRKGFK
jgi:hypothetical protein